MNLIHRLAFCFFVFVSVSESACNQKTAESKGEKVDILISGAKILTSEPEIPLIENGYVAIRNGKIVDLGAMDSLGQRYISEKMIDGKGKLVMPGLINTHTHAAMTLFRGLANDLPLQEWLEKHIWPAEAGFVKAGTVYAASLVAMGEMVQAGTTTFCDMYFFEEEVARAAKMMGVRAVLGEGILNFPTPSHPNPDEALAYSARMVKNWAGDPLINIVISPHSPYTCSEALLQKCRKYADSLGVRMVIHLAETRKEVADIQAQTGLSPVEYLNKIGFLGEDVLAAHCVHLSKKDISILGATHTHVSHNPQSNMKLTSGVAPVPDLLAAGINVGLGTDGVASNNDLNLWEEMNTTSLLQKLFRDDPTIMTPQEVLHMATLAGAEALGLDDITGSLKVGKQADLIMLDLSSFHLHPNYDIYSLLVYSADASDVESVIIDGKMVMENHRLLTIDSEEVIANFERIADEIRKKMIP
ncbi:MAG: amidohydrolase [Bacteroidia bacterium]